MHVTGKCHCSQITFQAEVNPNDVSICHCTDCQNLTGSAYRVTVQAPRDKFELLTGQPKTYVKTADDGTKRVQAFCSNCGSPIYAAAVVDSPTYGLRVGCIDQRRELPPRKRIWCRSELPWSGNIDSLPKFEAE